MRRTCSICGDPTRNWEMCCNACTSGLAPDDPKFVLGHSPVLIYRILNAGGVAIAAVGVGVAAFIISRLIVNDVIVRHLSGAYRTLSGFALLAVLLVVLLMCTVALYEAKNTLTSSEVVLISRAGISYTGIRETEDGPPSIINLKEQIPANFTLRVSQGPFGRLFGYGRIDIQADKKWNLLGVRDPDEFAARLNWLGAHRGQAPNAVDAARVSRFRKLYDEKLQAVRETQRWQSESSHTVAAKPTQWWISPLVALPIILIVANVIGLVIGLVTFLAIDLIPGDFQGLGIIFGALLDAGSNGFFVAFTLGSLYYVLHRPHWFKMFLISFAASALNWPLLSFSLFKLTGDLMRSLVFGLITTVAACIFGVFVLSGLDDPGLFEFFKKSASADQT